MHKNVRFDCLDVDVPAGQLFKRGLRVRLREKSFQVLERMEQMATKRIVPPTWMALAYDSVGDDRRARACMERAIEERHMLLVHARGWMASNGWLSGYRNLLDEHGL